MDSRPQEALWGRLIDQGKRLPGVTHIIQRGSFAKQTSDRVSDIDILLIVEDRSLGSIIDGLDQFVKNCTPLLYPTAWVDTIVPDFGGIGFTYIAEFEGRLVQLDLYVTPLSWAERIYNFPEKKILYTRPDCVLDFSRQPASKELIEHRVAAREVETEVILKFLIMTLIASKQIYRSRTTLAVKYRYATIEALAQVIRLIYTPDRLDYNMYDWSSDLDSFNSPHIKRFERCITHINVYSEQELLDLLRLFESLLYESRLQSRLQDFRPLIRAIEQYGSTLLKPEY